MGFLYIRNGIPIGAWQHGGMQERGRRAGTENVAGAVGFAAAAAQTMEMMEEVRRQEESLQRFFYELLLKEIPESKWHGPLPGSETKENGIGMDTDTVSEKRLFNNVNFSIPGLQAEPALIALDREGICASAGSACTTGVRSPSHVLTAMGISEKEAGESLRFTLGEENTEEEICQVVEALVRVRERIRSMEMDWE